MKLTLWAVKGTEDQIARACRAADQVLADAGLTPVRGYLALLRAHESYDSIEDGDAITVWYGAEAAALLYLYHATGVWPEGGSLIVVPS